MPRAIRKLPLITLFTYSLITLFAPPAPAADWTLTTSDFQSQSGLTINTWTPTEGLSVTTSSGKLLTVETRNVLSLSANRSSEPAPDSSAWRLSLRNGDLLRGDALAISGQSLNFRTPDLGPILIPLKNISALSAPAAPRNLAPATPDKDTVFFTNGDILSGFLLNLDPDKLQLSTEGTATSDIKMSLISRVAFSGLTPPRTLPPLSARITFTSGSILTIPIDEGNAKNFSWQISDLTLKDPAAQDHKLKIDRIAAIDILGGKVIYLSDLDPTSDTQTSFLGTHWPTRINQNVLGQPLKVARNIYPHGLGVHTTSVLTYDLAANFQTLKLRVGMDDSAAPRGMADITILADNKPLWHIDSLKPGQLSEDLTLPLTGVKSLELRATPAAADTTAGKEQIDLLGRVDYLYPALIRQ